ncbi:NADH-quinone oxidoreductase subunit J [Magnetospira sp. QH-2]|uniref:NADH-quinone oxidoreductase subunit J n=1 Tax=Magnetospira sp. (strain QH-2) TaxID=1288970 RepID=UPI0003E81996|nr:NADH-quinone oxidoreductase subunit J [Magnetospira sp. QH-2]CCQ73868.1 NADH-quinone oxidoreductase chain J (NADH dehydrogenase I, chain J) (NDH-1, chain J) [Magnetospira sp. QH-2]
MIAALAFYLFAALTVFSAVMVISSRNPVHAVLFLILAFFNSAALFLLLGAEFIAMILIIVYVGAVAVLFLFVVMMLDVNFAEMRAGFLRYLPIGGAIGLILMIELIAVLGGLHLDPDLIGKGLSPTPDMAVVSNTEAIGNVLYTDYIYLFQAAGMVLFVAMIGAIVLTHRKRPGVRKQKVADQVARGKDVELRKVPTGGGI